LECPNNANTFKNKHDEFGADSNDYKNIPLNVARFAQANARISSRNKGRFFCIAKKMTLITVSCMRLLDEAAIAEKKSGLRR
jgi:hypothetical protein